MQTILKYFPNLSEEQIQQFQQLEPLYRDWNSKINVISRKDIDNLYAHHILHSLAIAKVVSFKAGAEVMDLGTGGGLPGIPLAILFPEVNFMLVDGTRKKISVVQAIIEELGLKNATARHARAEETKLRFDFVVCRAVATFDKLYGWSERLFKNEEQHALPNGLIGLKGGNVKEELKLLPRGSYSEIYPISDFYEEKYYEEKFVVYVQA